MQLTPNFDLSELVASQTAARRGIDNTPTPEIIENLQHLATQLELVRTLLGAPLHISSGYRCPELNLAIGGARNSQHLAGQAADFTAPKFGTPAEIVDAVRESNIDFDQVILEFDRWVHISFKKSGNKRQALVIDKTGTRVLG